MSNNRIQILPQQVANQIAAGEVVNRPSDVVKELMENSIDSGATVIDVMITDSGRTSIQIIDDGCGMSSEDAVTAFLRHATSKISKVEDLSTLQTMGFRGEALPSIASVSQVTLTTRQQDDVVGTCLHIDGGAMSDREYLECPVGTNIKVDNLFYNVRARRAFLGSDSQEKSHIVKAFVRIALVYPNVAFSLAFNGKTMFRLSPTTTRQRIADIFSKKITDGMMNVSIDTTIGCIHGYVGHPKSAHKKNVQQFLFVNGRYIEHTGYKSAVATAYERLIPKSEKVPFFLFMKVDPKDIDVNIHPNKTEVKFKDERALWQIIRSGVSRSIGNIDIYESAKATSVPKPINKPINKEAQTPTIDFDDSDMNRIMEQHLAELKQSIIEQQQNLAAPQQEPSFIDDKTFMEIADSIEAETPMSQVIPTENAFQFKGSYIITPIAEGLMVIDQERAHERILFERYKSQFAAGVHASQTLMFHDTVAFSRCEADKVAEIINDLEGIGFDFSDLGGCTYAINAVPSGIENTDVKRLVTDLVNNVLSCSYKKASTELIEDFATTIVRKTAIAHGEYLAQKDIVSLLTDLNKCRNNQYSPSGKPICRIIPQKQIVSLFCA